MATGSRPLYEALAAVYDGLGFDVLGDETFQNLVVALVALRPYDLRHAAISTWLNSGVPPTKVATWAGHSVDILLKIYAKCIDGDDA